MTATGHGIECPRCGVTRAQMVLKTDRGPRVVKRYRRCEVCKARYTTTEVPQGEWDRMVRLTEFVREMARTLREEVG